MKQDCDSVFWSGLLRRWSFDQPQQRGLNMESTQPKLDPPSERSYHNYTTHRIPWFVRLIWVGYWVGLVWYLIKFGISSAKNYF